MNLKLIKVVSYVQSETDLSINLKYESHLLKFHVRFKNNFLKDQILKKFEKD